MKRNTLALFLALFLFPLVSGAATVSIENVSFSGGGNIAAENASGNNTASNSHSGISSTFEDFWNVSLVPSSESFSIVSSIPKFNEFNVQYRFDSASPWVDYVVDSSNTNVEVLITSIANVANFELHVFGDATNDLNTAGTYQMTVNSVNSVPVPAAVWLFGSALVGLVGFSRRKSSTLVA